MNLKTRLDNLYKKLVFSLASSDSFIYIAFYKYFYKPSAGSLSEFINNFSEENPGLQFVQVGANDGYNRDPFAKFIKRDKWKGVLIEPQKYVYEAFLRKLYQNSNRIKTFNYALDAKKGNRTMYRLSFSNARWATGLTSFSKDVLEDAIDRGHVAGHAKRSGIKLPEKKEDYIIEESVETITPQDLLAKENIGRVDLLAIDTEGFDYQIIKLFNIPKLKPRVVIYENLNLPETEKIEAVKIFEENGYKTKNISKDTIAILANDKDVSLLG